MGRKGNQKQNRGSWKSQNPNAQKAFLTDDHYESPSLSRYSPDSLRSLRKELKDAIAEIYFKYFSQFQCRKESRILRQDPTYSVCKEELNIEKNYCNELTQKVKQLVHLDSLEDIHFTFCKILNSFMGQIYSELQGLKNSDPYLQLACLSEAYFVVENSWKELGKVTKGIFEKKHVNCENVTRLAFLDEVVKHYKDLIAACPDGEVCETIQSVINMEKELWGLGDRLSSLDKHGKDQTSQFLSPNVNYCVDEIVNFINGDFKEIKKKVNKRRRVSKASTADTSGSPFDRRSREDIRMSLQDSNFFSSLDKEVEQFQCVLESAKPLYNKLKPSLSEEWVKKLRSLLHK